MDTQLTDLTILLDRSGSMASIRADMEGGLNALVADQAREPGRIVVSLYKFDDTCELAFGAVPAGEVRPIALEPRGSTALLDALAQTIDETGVRLSAMTEARRPGKVIVVIVTDGQENASRRTNWSQAAERIVRQRDQYQWQFIFLGANMDAIAAAGQLNIAAADSMTFRAAPMAVGAMSASLSKGLSRKRAAMGMASAPAFEQSDRDAQK